MLWKVIDTIVSYALDRGERPTADIIKSIIEKLASDVETRVMLVAQLADLYGDARGVLDAFTPKGTIPRLRFDVSDEKEPTE